MLVNQIVVSITSGPRAVFAVFNTSFNQIFVGSIMSGPRAVFAVFNTSSYTVKKELAEEYPHNPFYKKVEAVVYAGLSDEQALRLAL